MSNTPLADSSAILWEESRRQLVRQESDLESLRARALAMLSVAALVAGLFGTQSLSGTHSTSAVGATTSALVFFGATVIAVLVVLMPKRHAWNFAHFPDYFFDKITDGTLNPIDVTFNLAQHFEQYRRENQAKLDLLYDYFLGICALVGLQVVAWGVAVA